MELDAVKEASRTTCSRVVVLTCFVAAPIGSLSEAFVWSVYGATALRVLNSTAAPAQCLHGDASLEWRFEGNYVHNGN